MFPLGVIPFTYATSFIFSSENIAQTVTIFMHFVFAGIGGIVVFILRIIESTYEVGDILLWVFKIIPSFCLTNSVMFASSKDRLSLLRPGVPTEDFALENMGGDLLILGIHFVAWTIFVLLVEIGAFNWLKYLLFCIKRNVPPKQDLDLDEDVVEEEKRVEETPKDHLKVRVHKFRKVYSALFKPPFLAVEKTSFGLDYGECFALLGVNGAGKTTTFKSLTGGIEPTSGEISINGLDILKDFNKVRKLIGYCP